MRQGHGGSFAPPVDDAKINEYELLANEADEQVKNYMLGLIKMLRMFRETAESSETPYIHPTRVAEIIPLEKAEIERIWDVVPWKEELDMMGTVFDQLPNNPLRNAAFHLLWFGRELCADREPITNDKLFG